MKSTSHQAGDKLLGYTGTEAALGKRSSEKRGGCMASKTGRRPQSTATSGKVYGLTS